MRKNLFKKVLALTLASTMAFSMAGCGSKGGSSDAKNDDGTITLNVGISGQMILMNLRANMKRQLKLMKKKIQVLRLRQKLWIQKLTRQRLTLNLPETQKESTYSIGGVQVQQRS